MSEYNENYDNYHNYDEITVLFGKLQASTNSFIAITKPSLKRSPATHEIFIYEKNCKIVILKYIFLFIPCSISYLNNTYRYRYCTCTSMTNRNTFFHFIPDAINRSCWVSSWNIKITDSCPEIRTYFHLRCMSSGYKCNNMVSIILTSNHHELIKVFLWEDWLWQSVDLIWLHRTLLCNKVLFETILHRSIPSVNSLDSILCGAEFGRCEEINQCTNSVIFCFFMSFLSFFLSF